MVDYSKWNKIEVSDDEDDTHPNIDTGSLFRWRHQARVDRMEEHKSKKDFLAKEKEKQKHSLSEIQQKLDKLDVNATTEREVLTKEMAKREKEWQVFKAKEKELEEEERKQPWNVDTLSTPGFQKTIINISVEKKKDMTEDEQYEQSKKFMDKHKEEIKKYGMLHEYHDSEEYLVTNPHLACEDSANYLVVWCIDLEVEEKHALMERVAHQTICIQFLLELAKSLDVDPRATIKGFFNKMRKAEDQYMSGFKEELGSFIGRIKGRAQARIDKALKEYEEEEKQKRIGPGGLDPVEIFQTLPEELQQCFESKNIQKLQDVLTTMPEDQAKYHLKRCIDSGLWIPDGNKAAEKDTATID